MPVIYVNEYLPSSATLKLGDPIYRASSGTERLQVGPPAATVIAVACVVGIGALIVFALSRA